MSLNKRLAEIEVRFEELNVQISDPSVISDRDAYAKLSREHAELKEVVDAYREVRSLEERVEEARSLLGDPELGDLAKEDLPQAESQLAEAQARLKVLLIPTDPLDVKNAILEIRAGTGGEEAALFAGDLFRMYCRYAENRGWKVEELSVNDTGIGGIKEVVALIKGKGVFGRLKFESGTHRVQRVPETESSGRIHTSAVTVAILPEADEIDVQINPDDLRMDVFRAGGAGGQHVNKTESAVRVTHIPTGLVVMCQDEKSQHKNRAKALKILQARLFEKMQTEADTERSQSRKLQVGSGDRSERIRTYNYPQGRVTDHRINLTVYRLDAVLQGDVDLLIEPLTLQAQADALAQNA